MLNRFRGIPLVLASSSPRRESLLRQIGLPFIIEHPDADESPRENGLSPEELVKKNAYEKALSVATRQNEGFIIGADTVVVVDGRILGKPSDHESAAAMLRELNGRGHFVYAGVAVFKNPGMAYSVDFAATRVTFRNISEGEINEYIGSGEPFGKAGAYGIQGAGALFVERIDGCYFNVVGLPLALLIRLMDSSIRENG